MVDKESLDKAPKERTALLQKYRLDGDLATATGPLGTVILNMRERARKARLRSGIFLGGMILVVILGLGLYLGMPFWQTYVTGTKRALTDAQASVLSQNDLLDAERGEILQGGSEEFPDGLISQLRSMPLSVDSGVYGVTSDSQWIVSERSILIFGDDLAISRSEDGGRSFENVPIGEVSGQGSTFLGHFVDGDRILLFGSNGSLAVSRDGGKAFSFPNLPEDAQLTSLRGAFKKYGTYFVYGDGGYLLRSLDDAATFQKMDSGQSEGEGNFFGHLELGERIIIYGRDQTVSYSDDGKRFLHDFSASRRNINGGLASGNVIVLFGDEDAILFSLDGGDDFDEHVGIDYPKGSLSSESPIYSTDFLGAADLIGKIYLFGTQGAIVRLGSQGRFENISYGVTSTSTTFVASQVNGDQLFLFGDDGTVVKVDKAGSVAIALEGHVSGFGRRSTIKGIVAGTNPPVHFGEQFGDIAISSDGGLTVKLLPYINNSDVVSGRRLADGTDLFLTYSGSVFRLSDAWSNDLGKLPLGKAETGDAELFKFLYGDLTTPGLPRFILDWQGVERELATLGRISRDREVLRKSAEQLEFKIEEASGSLPEVLSGKRALASFDDFMRTCRSSGQAVLTGADFAALTQHCLAARADDQSQADGSWWVSLGRQLPAAVLLMFMLVTFSMLYRYNLRLASFHDSRADVLEVLALETSGEKLRDLLHKNPADILNRMTLALAADRVDSGTMRLKVAELDVTLAETAARLETLQKGGEPG